MYLTKFTKQKYKDLAITGRDLRVGSFFAYRAIENEKFRDEARARKSPVAYPESALARNTAFAKHASLISRFN